MKKNRDNPIVPDVYLIERPVVPKKTIAGHTDAITKFEDRFLSARIKELGKGIKAPTGTQPDSPMLPNLDFGQTIVDERAKFLRFQPELLLPPLPIAYGTRVFSPPYDNSWQTGAAGALSHRDGRPSVMATDGGSSSTSGFCIYISSPKRVFATVTFHGTYKFNWFTFGDCRNLRSSGGLAACLYKGNDTALALIRRSTLFTIRDPRPFKNEQGGGQLSTVRDDPAGPSPNTFASYLLPISLLMEPSVTYGIWLWCWHAAVGMTGAHFGSFVSCDVPAVTISTSEPYIPLH